MPNVRDAISYHYVLCSMAQFFKTGCVALMALLTVDFHDRGCVIETGRISPSGTGRDLLNDSRIRAAYLGL